jgi:prepilin peptidase CpaA
MIIAMIVTLIFAAPLMTAAYTDYSSMKIPNKIVVALFFAFFLTLPLHWQGLPVLGEHLGMFAAFFAAGFAMFALGWMGGGDAKLMAAIALWFGWADALPFILYTTLFGAAIALFLMMSSKFAPVRLKTSAFGMKMYQGGKDMPYGIALAAGALFVWPNSQIGLALLG